MRNLPALTRREMNSLFCSPLAYVVLCIFLLFGGLMFSALLTHHKAATPVAEGTSQLLNFLFLVATPLLTMRLLSEEYRSGNIENLMTAPVTDTEVVVAKFLGALVLYLFVLAPTLVYHVILALLGRPDWGIVLAGYAGLLFMGFEFVALGTLASALTSNQIIAAVLALIVQLGLWLLGMVGEAVHGPLRDVLDYASLLEHFRPFLLGRIAFRDALYFLSLGAFWLFLAVRVLESRRWR